MIKPLRYKVIWGDDIPAFEKALNDAAAEGYELEQYNGSKGGWSAVMKRERAEGNASQNNQDRQLIDAGREYRTESFSLPPAPAFAVNPGTDKTYT